MNEAGAAGDVLYNFIDEDGVAVKHPINDRVISVNLETLARIPQRVLVSGGNEKIVVIKAAMRAVAPTVLITDEVTTRTLLKD